MSQTARQYGLQLETCAEAIELADLGIGHASCIDAELLGCVGGCRLDTVKDKISAVNAAVPPVSISAPITPVCMAAFIVMLMTAADSCSRSRLEIAVRRCCAVSWSLRIRLRKETCGRCGHCRQSFFKYRFCCQTAGINFLKKLLDLELTPLDMIQIRNGSSGILVMSGRNKKQVIWRFCISADCVFSYNGFECRTM